MRLADLLHALRIDGMARSDSETGLERAVGKLEGRFDALHEEMQALASDVKKSRQENQHILSKVDKVEAKLDPLPEAVAKQDARLVKLEQFDGRLMGIVTLAGLTMSAIGTGLTYLLLHFSDVIALAKRMFTGSP